MPRVGGSRSSAGPLPNCGEEGSEAVTQDEENEATEPAVADVPEPDQDPAEEEAEEEAHEREQGAGEPTEAPEPQGAQQDEWEKRYASAEKYFATYTRRIAEKWGDDAIHLAPFNIDPSAPPGFIDMRNAGHVDEDTKAAAMEFLGFPREQDYEPDPEARQCGICKGKGRTKHAPAGERVEPLASGDVDSWQQPRILPDGRPNPNYGKTPDYWIDVAPWGSTRFLTAQSEVS
jgi:hypothetical protein